MKAILFLLLLSPAPICGQEEREPSPTRIRASDVGATVELIGATGLPLGKRFEIEGKIVREEAEHHKDTPHYFVLVRVLNGKKLPNPLKFALGDHDERLAEDEWLSMTGFEDAFYSRTVLPNSIGAPEDGDDYLGHRLITSVVILHGSAIKPAAKPE